MSETPAQAGRRSRHVSFQNVQHTTSGPPAPGSSDTAEVLPRQHAVPPVDQAMRRQPVMPKPQTVAWCITVSCILFSLLVIATGVAVLVVYLYYRPQAPRLGVATATLNAGYLDELEDGSLALNSDLTVLATIGNPNVKVEVVLKQMVLDLLFRGKPVATQAVWPAPLHEEPGGSVLRNVHLAVSEVAMGKEDAAEWRNATGKGGPVRLQLAGRFRTQLRFGRWLRYTYLVYPTCSLWLDPPPHGALRTARCS